MPNPLFSTIETLPANRSTGPGTATVDLTALLPAGSAARFLTFICVGSFEGNLSVQGSMDGTNWGALASFSAGRDGTQDKFFEPQTIEAIVRYLRLFFFGTILKATTVTFGAVSFVASVEGISGGVPVPVSGSVSAADAAGTLALDRIMTLLEEQANLLRELVIHNRSITGMDLSKGPGLEDLI